MGRPQRTPETRLNMKPRPATAQQFAVPSPIDSVPTVQNQLRKDKPLIIASPALSSSTSMLAIFTN